ncbi:MAG: CPBP family intramembrane metalloprotease [Muribaculaceae bacterium]|nr:CPBP family intramembrane metalloprotease [Roseburia sp.]MCM1431528.1 CPBP family intramembrane metalloprotease [Muribaculaceae bacterium]MCM1493821.1 CPBP family intramembrane metalloprotease [Muribaculaceae bacterium]
MKKNKAGIWIAGVSLIFVLLGAFVLFVLQGTETAASDFTGLGVKALPAILVYAVFNTAFPEELLFRGFLLKRLQSKFGFAAANTVQAFLFGLLHGIMFFTLTGAVKAILIIIFTGVIAWFMGYINEKKADGSLIPGWIIHSISNLFSGICSAFLLI